jgi:hypothetical protein
MDPGLPARRQENGYDGAPLVEAGVHSLTNPGSMCSDEAIAGTCPTDREFPESYDKITC